MTNAYNDYQDLLKAAALRFVLRHQCEHLGDDAKLFDRTVSSLVNDHDVLTQMAEKVTNLAMIDASNIRDRQRLDTTSSTTTHSIIVDPETGEAWAIPVSLIYERILCAPDSSRFRVATA